MPAPIISRGASVDEEKVRGVVLRIRQKPSDKVERSEKVTLNHSEDHVVSGVFLPHFETSPIAAVYVLKIQLNKKGIDRGNVHALKVMDRKVFAID